MLTDTVMQGRLFNVFGAATQPGWHMNGWFEHGQLVHAGNGYTFTVDRHRLLLCGISRRRGIRLLQQGLQAIQAERGKSP